METVKRTKRLSSLRSLTSHYRVSLKIKLKGLLITITRGKVYEQPVKTQKRRIYVCPLW